MELLSIIIYCIWLFLGITAGSLFALLIFWHYGKEDIKKYLK